MTSQTTEIPQGWDRRGLPAWSFFNPEMLELAEEVLFRFHWKLICHLSDILNAGSEPAEGQLMACNAEMLHGGAHQP